MVNARRPWRLAFSVFFLAALTSGLASRGSAQEEEPRYHLTPREIQLYRQAPTLMDWTSAEIRSRPELRDLQPTEDQQALPAILQEVGMSTAELFDGLPNLTSTETVQSQICSPRSGRCRVSFEGKFRYLLLMRSRQGEDIPSEYRTDAKGKAVDYARLKNVPLLTSRFTSTALHFHPQNQVACRFRYLGRQILDGHETDVVGFVQIPDEDAHVTVFGTRGRTAELLVQGFAWIDTASHEILRLRTDLLAPRLDVGLENETTETDFSAIHLPDTSNTFRLPTRVVVNVRWFGQHFRNIHEYSDFKLFRVESRIGPVPEN
jgi:hypothetical protein